MLQRVNGRPTLVGRPVAVFDCRGADPFRPGAAAGATAEPAGQIVDRVAYTVNQVHDGRTICFGR